MVRIERKPNTEYILSLSYGKDSIACLFAIEQLGWPLDRIVHAEVWATDAIHADLPPMVDFKAKADAIIRERWGIEVEHVCAMRDGKKLTYEDLFYHIPVKKCKSGGYTDSRWSEGIGVRATSNDQRCGWPHQIGSWCKKLKPPYVRMAPDHRRMVPEAQGERPGKPFQPCAVDGALIQMPSSTWASQQTSRSESPGTPSPDTHCRWSQ